MQRSTLVQLLDVLKQADSIFPADNAQLKTKQDLDLRLAFLRLQIKVQNRIAKLKPPGKL